MSLSLAAAGLIGAGVTAGAGVLGNLASNIINIREAKKNRDFQRSMAQSNVKHLFQQANDLGISPSLLLGDQTNSLGGSQAQVNSSGISNAVNGIMSVINEQNRLKTLEEMNEDRIDAMKELKMSNSANNKIKKGDIDKVFSNMEYVEV